MATTEIIVCTPDIERDIVQIRQLRHEVLDGGRLEDIEFDYDPVDFAPTTLHRVGYAAGMLVATGRLDRLPNGIYEVRKVAVNPRFRGFELGRRVMEELEKQATARGDVTEFVSWSREDAIGFYACLGYVETGAKKLQSTGYWNYEMRKQAG